MIGLLRNACIPNNSISLHSNPLTSHPLHTNLYPFPGNSSVSWSLLKKHLVNTTWSNKTVAIIKWVHLLTLLCLLHFTFKFGWAWMRWGLEKGGREDTGLRSNLIWGIFKVSLNLLVRISNDSQEGKKRQQQNKKTQHTTRGLLPAGKWNCCTLTLQCNSTGSTGA